jgi:parallel beta-helix repeat protein
MWVGTRRYAGALPFCMPALSLALSARLHSAAAKRVRPPLLVAIFATAVAAALVLSSEPALANHVSCGDTITTDTTLDSDLVNCPSNGIVIGADGITLDLAGHRIDGDEAPAAGCDPENEFCDIGVLNDGHDGVTITDGSVQEFDYGLAVGNAHENRVLRISSRRQVLFGAVIFGSARSLIRGGTFSHNIPPEGDGIGVFGCRHIRIVDNEIRSNEGPGIHLGDSSHNVVKQNTFERNGPSVSIEGNANHVSDNRVVGGAGILATGDRNVITENHVSRALDSVAIEDGHRNLVAHNLVAHARGDQGISLGINHPPIGGGGNVVRENRVKDSHEDGFHVAGEDSNSVLKRNLAVGAGDDGFNIQGHSTRITGNRALSNDDLGIRAHPSSIDGGGNVARNNGDPRQCTYISCS